MKKIILSKDSEITTKKLVIPDQETLRHLCGERNAHLKLLEERIGVALYVRGNVIILQGHGWEIDLAENVLLQLTELIKSNYPIYPSDVDYAIKILSDDPNMDLKNIFKDEILISSKKKIITPKTINQKKYIECIRKYDIVFGIGPAGTGKTYLAMAMAVNFLMNKSVRRIILTRPAIEAGESLGYLPGDMYEKVGPYLRPLYDALYDMMEVNRIQDYIERGIIEVAPLAYMRGRTLNDSFIILDEAQNSTPDQMKMFLTRLGFDSKTLLTGDATQSDLPSGRESGLDHVQRILKNIKGIKFIHFTGEDVVRHPLVQDIVRAYDRENRGTS